MSLASHPEWDNVITLEIAKNLRSGANAGSWKRVEWDVPTAQKERKNKFVDSQSRFHSVQNEKTVVLKYFHFSKPPPPGQHKSRRAPTTYHRIVAVKLGKPRTSNKYQDDPFRSIHREIRIMQHILQANIRNEQLTRDHLLLMTACYQDGSGESPIMVTDFMTNQILYSYIANNGLVIKDFSKNRILDLKLQLCIDIASAIAYLHECGVLHNDLKPGNIFLDSGFRARVADFDYGWINGTEKSSKWEGTEGYSKPAPPAKTEPNFSILKDHFHSLPPVYTCARDLFPMGLIFYKIWIGGAGVSGLWGFLGWALSLEEYQQELAQMIRNVFNRPDGQLDGVANVIYNLMKWPVVTREDASFDYSAFQAWSSLASIRGA